MEATTATASATHLLSVLIWLPAIAGLFILFLPRQSPGLLRAVGLGVGLIEFGKSLQLLIGSDYARGFRFVENAEWIPSMGIRYHLGIDGLSLWMVVLTTFLTPLVLHVSLGSIKARQKEYVAAMLILQSAMIGAFCALDMFLFYVFWELMLIPMFLIIGIFGGANRVYAAVKFFIYTFAGSIFMLIALVYMAVQFRALDAAHRYSFDYFDLMRLGFPRNTEILLFLAFAIAFAIKVPMFPLHTWLPDAHTEAPTGGSMILAAVMLKLGTYGFMRFAMPFFPGASHMIGPTIAGLSCAGILYGAGVAWRQRDFKKLIAYSSVSHMGFVMLGIISRTPQGATGAVLQSINHGVSTGALFLLVGVIYDRRHTRELSEFGGLAKVMPWYAFFFVLVTMSSIGLPFTNGFVGEFLIITGTFTAELLRIPYHVDRASGPAFVGLGPMFAAFAALGVLFGAIYMLEAVQKVFFGPLSNRKNRKLQDLNSRELTGLIPLAILILWIGLRPQDITKSIEPDVQSWIDQYEQKRQVVTRPGSTAPYLLSESDLRPPRRRAPSPAAH
ncbi:MAG: NADH-quinone oxidoreductase subunit M [Deltaproteobacteria bacterium]|nr:NADH-quinone oxidoreductase subunit M [Deltaproteobacteria bacterium]